MRKALFPGSFDPFTLGHEEIVRRATGLFDEIFIGIGVNSSKKTMFSLEERTALIEAAFADEPKVKVTPFQGLTVDFARENGIDFLLRGLRNGADLEYEKPIALINRQISENLETVFLISSGATAHISSTLVREVYRYGASLDGLLSPEVIAAIRKLRPE